MPDNTSVISSAVEQAKPTIQRIVLLGILFLTALISYLDRVNVSVLAADNNFLTEMGIKGQPVQMGMLMSLFLIAYGLSNVVLSPIGDKIGPRTAMSISIFLWAVALFGSGFAATFSLMLVARVLLGVGEGMHWPMNSKFVKNWFPPKERGKANAVWLLGIWVGPALAMPLFSWFIAEAGWRASFFGLAALGLVPLYLIWFYTTDRPEQNKRINQAELKHIQEGILEEAENEAKVEKANFWQTTKVFVFDYRYWLVIGYYATSSAIYWGMMFWLPSYLKVVRGFSWTSMGMLASLPFVLGGIASLVFGNLSDRFGRRAPFCMATGICCTVALYFGAFAVDDLTAALLIAVGVGAIGIGHPSSWTLMQSVVPSRAVGTGAGLMNGVTNAFSSLVPIIIGYFISITGGYIGGLMFLVALGGIATLCMVVLTIQKY